MGRSDDRSRARSRSRCTESTVRSSRSRPTCRPGCLGCRSPDGPTASVVESRDRIRAAVQNSGLDWPQRRITIALLPADVPKSGSRFDLALALAVLAAAGGDRAGVDPRRGLSRRTGPRRKTAPGPRDPAVSGGGPTSGRSSRDRRTGQRLRGRPGGRDRRAGGRRPGCCGRVAQWRWARSGVSRDRRGRPGSGRSGPRRGQWPGHGQAWSRDRRGRWPPPLPGRCSWGRQDDAGRAPAGVAAPARPTTQALEVSAVHSVAGTLPPETGLLRRPPLQAPHHTASVAALVGGGTGLARPGAISLAHHGVLFLDEAPEFSTHVIDALRQPLESGEVTLARALGAVRYPARFLLVLAANPCPCGRSGRDCVCTPTARRRYEQKLSGPLLDRVDLRIDVAPVSRAELFGAEPAPSESSAAVAARVSTARTAAATRWAPRGWRTNSEVPGLALREKRWRLPASGDSRGGRSRRTRTALRARIRPSDQDVLDDRGPGWARPARRR